MQINSQHLIQFYNESQTEYVYSALGEKLKTIHRTATLYSSSFDGNDTVVDGNPTSNSFPMPRLLSSGEAAQITDTASCQDMTATTILSIDTTEYIGNFIFENGRPDKFLFPGGYYSYAVGRPTRTGGDGGGCYYLTDHLGNNRVVVNDNGDIEQITHYYPFGAVYGDAGKNPDFQKHKYTGKELDLTHGLNTYDHGARQNYSILGVWDRVDPMAEKYYNISPYVSCFNNPVLTVDIDGKDGYIIFNGNNITIKCDIYFYGDGATKNVVNQIQKDINSVWGKNFNIVKNNIEYSVRFSIKTHLYKNAEKSDPFIIPDAWNPKSRNNYVELKKSCKRSVTNGFDEGTWRAKGRNGKTLAEDDSAPHEVGHLLGLLDKYKDDGDSSSTPYKNWDGNIMANGSEVNNKNIEEILKNAWKKYEIWKEKGGKGIFTYEINP